MRSTAADPLLEYWNIMKMEYWNIGHHGTKVYWYIGILVYWYGILIYWNTRILYIYIYIYRYMCVYVRICKVANYCQTCNEDHGLASYLTTQRKWLCIHCSKRIRY